MSWGRTPDVQNGFCIGARCDRRHRAGGVRRHRHRRSRCRILPAGPSPSSRASRRAGRMTSMRGLWHAISARICRASRNVIVQNMPGAGGLRGANYLYNVAAKDGTVMGVVSQTVAVGQVLGTTPGIQYDASQIHLDRPRERQCRGRSRLARVRREDDPGRDGARDDRRRHRADLVIGRDAPADERAGRYPIQDRHRLPGPDLGATRVRARRGRRHREALVEHQERHAGVAARQEDQSARPVHAGAASRIAGTCRRLSISQRTTSSAKS